MSNLNNGAQWLPLDWCYCWLKKTVPRGLPCNMIAIKFRIHLFPLKCSNFPKKFQTSIEVSSNLYLQLLDGIPSDFVSDNYWSMYGESGCFPLWQTGSMVSILTSYYVRFVFCATGNMHALNATGSTYSLYFTSRAFGEEKGKKKPWCPSSENAP